MGFLTNCSSDPCQHLFARSIFGIVADEPSYIFHVGNVFSPKVFGEPALVTTKTIHDSIILSDFSQRSCGVDAVVDIIFLGWVLAVIAASGRLRNRTKVARVPSRSCELKFTDLLVVNHKACQARDDLNFSGRKILGNRLESQGMSQLHCVFIGGLEGPFQHYLTHLSGGGDVDLGGRRQHGGRRSVAVPVGGGIVSVHGGGEWRRRSGGEGRKISSVAVKSTVVNVGDGRRAAEVLVPSIEGSGVGFGGVDGFGG
jgi:hypothetical protein